MVPGFASALEAHGRSTALITAEGRHVSYIELAALADTEAVGFPPERALVALPMQSSLQAVAQYLAALRLGYPVILIDGVDTVAAQRITEIYRPWLPGAPHPERIPALHPDLALMLSTSGTTGSPKLVRLSGVNLTANAASIGEYLAIDAATRAITTLPLHCSYGLSVLNSHLAAGASVVLTEESVAAPAFWSLFEAQNATSLAGVPFTYELFESIGLRNRPLPSLKTMTQAGGRLPPALVRRYAEWAAARGIRFFVMYGQTEATARTAYLAPEKALNHGDCIGVAIPGGAFHLVDEDGGCIDGAGRSGELVYSGPNVMMGYAQKPADLALGAEIAALHTGDLAERTDDGLYRIVGRRSRFVKPFGLRVCLDEIETMLGRQGVSAMVAGVDDLVAVAFCPAAGVTEASIAAQLADLYPLPPTLFDIASVPELPHLATGKRDYQRILTAARARRSAPPSTPLASQSFAASFAAIFRSAPRSVTAATSSDAAQAPVAAGSASFFKLYEAEVMRRTLVAGSARDGESFPLGLSPRPLAQRFEVLDSLRGICALLVCLFHFHANGRLTELGFVRGSWLFVDFFFVLSGFVIAANYRLRLIKGGFLREFVVLRFGRVYPLHLAMLLAYVALELVGLYMASKGAVRRPMFDEHHSVAAIFTNLTLTQAFGLHDMLTWNQPSWSIAVEFWTYLLFAFVARRAGEGLERWLVIAIGASILILLAVTPNGINVTYSWSLVRCIYGFAVGAIIWWVWQESGRQAAVAYRGATRDELATVIAVVLFVSFAGQAPANIVAPLLFGGAVLVFARAGGAISRALLIAPLRTLGALSFSIYMVHAFVQSRFDDILVLIGRLTRFNLIGTHITPAGKAVPIIGATPLQGLLLTILMLVCVVAVSHVTWRLVELPGQRLARRVAKPATA